MTRRFAHVVSVSGGKDSTATYLRAIERGKPFQAVFADTGHEHPATYEYVSRLAEITGGPEIKWVKADFTKQIEFRRNNLARHWTRDGVPAEQIERAMRCLVPTGNPFLDMCMLKGRFPAAKSRFCTEELKLAPMFEQVQRPILKDGRILVSWQGVRADESFARAGLPKWQRINPVPFCLPKAVRDEGEGWTAFAYRPLIDWAVEDVFAQIARHGIEPNPLYSRGMKRVGCMPCIMCGKDELRNISVQFPEEIDRVREWEAIVASVAKRGCATLFAVSDDPTYDASIKPDHVQHGIDARVEWSRTTRGGRQFSLFSADANTACNEWGACE